MLPATGGEPEGYEIWKRHSLRSRTVCYALDRPPFQLHDDPRRRVPVSKRSIHHDRSRSRRTAADAAYSIASAVYDDRLEFFSIKVPDGPLTSRLQHLVPGMQVLIGQKPTGTLLLDGLSAGRRLYLLGTGTGVAPFASIVRAPETYERFESVALVHGCRKVAETNYSALIVDQLMEDEFLGADACQQLAYYPTVTREPFRNSGRITDLLLSGKLGSDLGYPTLDPALDRVMVCGSQSFNSDIVAYLNERGFVEGSSGEPAHFVIEKAFVEPKGSGPSAQLAPARSEDHG